MEANISGFLKRAVSCLNVIFSVVDVINELIQASKSSEEFWMRNEGLIF